MKELTAAFQSEVFRPVVSLIVPGFYASSTLLIVLWQRTPAVLKLADEHPSSTFVIALLTTLSVGLIIEEWGARLEQIFDERLVKVEGYENHKKEWFDYLRLAFTVEPVGHRYLRTLVLRLKFELGMTIASIPFCVGCLFLRMSCTRKSVLIVSSLVFCVFFLNEAKCSNKTLSELRREMLKDEV